MSSRLRYAYVTVQAAESAGTRHLPFRAAYYRFRLGALLLDLVIQHAASAIFFALRSFCRSSPLESSATRRKREREAETPRRAKACNSSRYHTSLSSDSYSNSVDPTPKDATSPDASRHGFATRFALTRCHTLVHPQQLDRACLGQRVKPGIPESRGGG